MSPQAPVRPSPAWLLPIVLAGYCWVVAPQLRVPLFWDEVNFYWNAEAVSTIGVPYANAGFLGDRGAIGSQYQYGLWHPPLYIYTLGLAFWLFGADESVARGTGVVLMALTALVVYLLGRATIPEPARDWGALLAVVILLVSPLTLQSALILDIDGTVLTLLLATWSLLYLHLEGARPRRQPLAVAVLAGVFAVALWAKLTTPLFLLGVVLVYQTLRWRPLRGIVHLLGIGVGGGVLFLFTWSLASDLLGLPFDMPFGVTWAELRDAAGPGDADLLGRMEGQVLPILAWVSPFLAALFGGAVVARVAALVRHRRLEPVDFLLGLGLLIGAIYSVKLAAGFPKYHVAMLPFWSVLIAHWLAVGWARLPRWASVVALLGAAAGCGLVMGYALVYVGDNWMLSPPSLDAPDGLGLAVAMAALLLPLAVLRPTGLGAVAASLVLVLYGGWAASADWYHTRANYQTNYWFGTRGGQEIAAVVDDLYARAGITGPYVGAKEVVFYTRHHFFLDQDTVFALWSEEGPPFDGRLFGHDVPLVAAWVRDPWVRHIFAERLARDYEPVAELHDYLVYLRRPLVAALFGAPASATDRVDPDDEIDAALPEPSSRPDAAPDAAVAQADGDPRLGAFREVGAGPLEPCAAC